MRIIFTARHGKASDKLREFAEKEVRRLKKYYDGIIDCEIVLDYVKLQQIADIKITVYGRVLNAAVRSEDIYKSIDDAVSKLERQLIKYKEKWKKKVIVDKSIKI